MSMIFKISPELAATLEHNNIKQKEYSPAYAGESVALDLYNTGDTIAIPPKISLISSNSNSDEVSDWNSIPTDIQKSTYKLLIPTGVHIGLENGYAGILKERSSITKTPLVLRAGVIDPGYTNQIYVNLINTSASHYYEIPKYAKLPVQLIIIPVYPNFALVDDETYALYEAKSKRKEAGFGSTNN